MVRIWIVDGSPGLLGAGAVSDGGSEEEGEEVVVVVEGDGEEEGEG